MRMIRIIRRMIRIIRRRRRRRRDLNIKNSKCHNIREFLKIEEMLMI